jgi:hypothetical protein
MRWARIRGKNGAGGGEVGSRLASVWEASQKGGGSIRRAVYFENGGGRVYLFRGAHKISHKNTLGSIKRHKGADKSRARGRKAHQRVGR